MSQKIKISKLNREHISFVHVLKSEPSAIRISGFDSSPSYDDIFLHVTRLVNLDPNISYVCSLGGMNIGLITAEYNKKNKVIGNLSINVLENWQNRKLGTHFISSYFIKMKTLKINFKRIEVFVNRDNAASINAFTRAGCEVVSYDNSNNVKLYYLNAN